MKIETKIFPIITVCFPIDGRLSKPFRDGGIGKGRVGKWLGNVDAEISLIWTVF